MALTRAGEARLCGPELLGQEGDILHLAVRSDAIDELDSPRLIGRKAGSSKGMRT